jgi:hypothetical protein
MIYRIENSARRGYFRLIDGRCGAVVRDELSWAAALQLRRCLELRLPTTTVRPAREDGSGDD